MALKIAQMPLALKSSGSQQQMLLSDIRGVAFHRRAMAAMFLQQGIFCFELEFMKATKNPLSYLVVAGFKYVKALSISSKPHASAKECSTGLFVLSGFAVAIIRIRILDTQSG